MCPKTQWSDCQYSLWSLAVARRTHSVKIRWQRAIFSPRIFSEPSVMGSAESPWARNERDSDFNWSLSYLLSITFTLEWTILSIPSTEAGCLSIKCGIPTSIFWLLIIPYFFSIFAFKSLSKISPFIIKSFVWIQKNTQDLDLVKRERKRILKHLVVCTMFCS